MLNYSDWHNMIAVSTKITIANQKPKEVIYRSYKNFDELKFLNDIEIMSFYLPDL